MLKGTTKSIIAAMLVLGTAVPSSLASTPQTSYQVGGVRPIVINGSTFSKSYVLDAKDDGTLTAFFGVYYIDQALNRLGATIQWNGSTRTWAITVPGNPDLSGVPVGNGNTTITVNGKVIRRINTFVAPDPSSGNKATPTTFFPIYYANQIFKALGNGMTWNGATGLTIVPKHALVVNGIPSEVRVGTPVTLTVSDNGQAVTQGVTWSVDNSSGAQITSSGVFTAKSLGSYTVTASYGNQSASAVVTVGQLGAPDAGQSIVQAQSGAIAGTNNVLVRVNARDKFGDVLNSGQAITIQDSAGHQASANWNATNFDYEATFSETVAGTVTFSAIDNGVSLNQASTTILPTSVDATASGMYAPTSVTPGPGNVVIRVYPRDRYGNALGSGQTVNVQDSLGVIVTAVWNSSGQYYAAPFTEDVSGNVTFTANVNGLSLQTQPVTLIKPGVVSSNLSIVTAPATAVAGQGVLIKIVPKDNFGNPLGSGQSILVSDGISLSSFTALWNSSSGDYEVTVPETVAQSYTFTATVNGTSLTATPSSTVQAAALNKLVFGAPTASEIAGKSYSVSLIGYDVYNNVTTQLTTAPNITGLNASPNNVTSTVNVAETVSGSGGTFTVTYTPVLATATVNLVATSAVGVAGNTSVVTQNSATFAVIGSTPATLVRASSPVAMTAGVSANFVLTAEDSYGNAANGTFSGNSLTVSGLSPSPNSTEPTVYGTTATTVSSTTQALISAGTLQGDFGSLTFTNGAASLPVTLTSASPQALAFTVSGGTAITAGTVTPAANALNKLSFGTPAATETAGQTYNVALTAYDVYGNVATQLTTLPSISGTALANSPGAVQSTSSVAETVTGTGGSFTVTYQPVNAASGVNLTANSAANADGNAVSITTSSATFNVSGATPAVLSAATAPGSAQAGVSANYTLTANDSFGNPANGVFGSTLALTIGGLTVSPSNVEPSVLGNLATTTSGTTTATLPAGTASNDLGAVNFTSGTASLPVTLTSASSQTLTFVVTGGATVTSAAVTPTPNTLSQFVWTTQPSNVTAGVAETTAKITAEDQYGNIETSLQTSPSGFLLSGTGLANGTASGTESSSLTWVNGVGSISFTTYKAGTGLTLSVSATGVTNTSTSTSFTVAASNATSANFANVPTTVAASTAYTPTIQLVDAYGNNTNLINSQTITLAVAPTSGSRTTAPTISLTATQGGGTAVSAATSITVPSTAFSASGLATFTYTSGSSLSPTVTDTLTVTVGANPAVSVKTGAY